MTVKPRAMDRTNERIVWLCGGCVLGVVFTLGTLSFSLGLQFHQSQALEPPLPQSPPVVTTSVPHLEPEIYPELEQSLAEGDFDQAAAFFATIPVDDFKRRKISGDFLIANWIKEDPLAVLLWVTSLGDDQESKQFRRIAFGQVEIEHLDEITQFLSLLQETGPSEDYLDAVRGISRDLASQDAERTLKWVLETTTGTAETIGAVQAAGMMLVDDISRLPEVIEKLPYGHARIDLMGRGVREWAREDSRAAAKWAISVTDENEKLRTVDGLLDDLAELDSETGIWVLENLGDLPEEEVLDLRRGFAREWGKVSREAAFAWAEAEDDDRLRLAVVRSQTNQDFEWAIDHAVKMKDPDQRDYTIASVFADIAATDPGRAYQLVLSSGDLGTPGAMRRVVFKWAFANPGDASEALRDLSAGPVRDAGVESLLVYLVKYKDYDSAQQWTDSLASEELREKWRLRLREAALK